MKYAVNSVMRMKIDSNSSAKKVNNLKVSQKNDKFSCDFDFTNPCEFSISVQIKL